MDRALAMVLAVVAGVIVVLGVAALVLTVGDDDEAIAPVVFEPLDATEFPPVEHDDAAARALIDAWSRWRAATFVSSGTWTRTLDAQPDAPLTVDVYTAQRQPRRYQVRFGEVTVIEDEADYERQFVAELRLVGGYVIGDERSYDVATSAPGCFQAELTVVALGSPWGRWAEYCFDDETGALVSARVRRQSAVDVERHDAIRAEVDDSDFGPLVGG